MMKPQIIYDIVAKGNKLGEIQVLSTKFNSPEERAVFMGAIKCSREFAARQLDFSKFKCSHEITFYYGNLINPQNDPNTVVYNRHDLYAVLDYFKIVDKIGHIPGTIEHFYIEEIPFRIKQIANIDCEVGSNLFNKIADAWDDGDDNGNGIFDYERMDNFIREVLNDKNEDID